MALPHIQNSQAGRNKWDPVHANMFEVLFTVPEALRNEFGKDEALLTEHIKKIDGLGALGMAPAVNSQKFMGTDRSYIVPKLDNTYAELSMDFTLNLRNDTDNYIYKLFRAWAALGYDVATGARSMKRDYCADWLNVSVATRNGDIIQQVIFKDVMLAGPLEGSWTTLDYEAGDAVELSVKMRSDWWTESLA